MKISYMLLLGFMFSMNVVSAQVVADVTNPSGVVFTPSIDHATIDSYELDLVKPDGTVLQTLNLGKPVPSATTGDITAAVNVQPVSFGTGYTMRVRARAGTAVSADAVSVNKFNRAPGPPSKVQSK